MDSASAFISPVVLLVALAPTCTTPPAYSGPQNFIYFGLDRERIQEPAFLETLGIVGAQLKYTWRELEPEPDQYDFQALRDDLAFLEQHGKRLFIQVQDVTFDTSRINVPQYLLDDSTFRGGVAQTYWFEDSESAATPEGWVARRWDPAVRARFIALLQALGGEFDGRIEGLNLPESIIEFGRSGKLHPDGFSYDGYAGSVKAIMTAAKEAFPKSHVIEYANFMPGESLPEDDRGYLRGIYAHAESIGVGVGGPDLLPYRSGQQHNSLPLIAARAAGTVAGLAVQYGNLDDVDRQTGKQVTVAELARYARDSLRLDYVFWGTQEPYYTNDIIPYLRALDR
jgi:hypothetical protein